VVCPQQRPLVAHSETRPALERCPGCRREARTSRWSARHGDHAGSMGAGPSCFAAGHAAKSSASGTSLRTAFHTALRPTASSSAPPGCTARADVEPRRSSAPFASVAVPLWALRASCSAASACVPCSDSVCLVGGPGGALYGTGLARMADSLLWHYFRHIALLEYQ
jgi:hypothetical protein